MLFTCLFLLHIFVNFLSLISLIHSIWRPKIKRRVRNKNRWVDSTTHIDMWTLNISQLASPYLPHCLTLPHLHSLLREILQCSKYMEWYILFLHLYDDTWYTIRVPRTMKNFSFFTVLQLPSTLQCNAVIHSIFLVFIWFEFVGEYLNPTKKRLNEFKP